jgi:hypothetical protein
MSGKVQSSEKTTEIIIYERRKERGAELSSTEIMKILRRRAAKVAAEKTVFEVPWDEKVG